MTGLNTNKSKDINSAVNSNAMLVQLGSPVYNEGDQVLRLYDNIIKSGVEFDELFFVYDRDNDNTLPFIEQLHNKDSRVRAEKNVYGVGVLNAMKSIFKIAKPGPLVVIMADNSDKHSVIPEMLSLWEKGATIVCPSRYSKGGMQHGGPIFKKILSGTSGKILNLFGFPTSDPTNNFKLYDGSWVNKINIESTGGFEIALELISKAYYENKNIQELPTEWWDRTSGESNFKLWAWLPKYLKWYLPLLSNTILFMIIGKKFSSKKLIKEGNGTI